MIKAQAGLLVRRWGHRHAFTWCCPCLGRTHVLTHHQGQEIWATGQPQMPGPRGRDFALSRGWAVCGADPSLLSPSWDLVASSISSAVLCSSLHPANVTLCLGSQNRPRGVGWVAHGTSILKKTGLCEGRH